MDVLRKAVKKSPKPFGKNTQASSSSKQHQKLPENWTDTREPVQDGMTFYLKYFGSTLVEELEEGESYGDRVSKNAITTIVNMAKMSGKKLSKVALTISTKGIKVVDMETKEVYVEHSIYRICFCTADSGHEKLFAYIARNTDNETIECYAFVCSKKKIAEAVTLTVAQTFNLAKEEEESQQERRIVVQNLTNLNLEDKISQNSSASNTPTSSENNSPALDRKFELTKPKSQLISEAQSAFDEEDEFSNLALSRHQKDQETPGESGVSSVFRSQQLKHNQLIPQPVKQIQPDNSRAVQIDDLLCL